MKSYLYGSGLGNLSSEERLEATDLPSVDYRRLRGTGGVVATEVYKYPQGVYKVDSSNFH